MKKKKAEMKPLDLCLVVGMFLTGFDSKKPVSYTHLDVYKRQAIINSSYNMQR